MRRALIAVLILVVAGCSTDPKKAKKDGEAGEGIFQKSKAKPVSVTSYVVGSREVPLVINAEGRTEPSDRYEAKSPANVKVKKVFVEEGAKVQPGDPLVKFEDELARLKLNVARAEVREAEAGIAVSNEQEKNREQLLADGKVTEAEADTLTRKSELYQAQLDRAKAQVELLERMTELEQLNSPIAGVVGKKTVSDGADATENQVLLEVVKLDPLHVSFKIPVDDVTALEKDAEIAITLTALPGQELTGEVASVGTGAEGGNGVTEVKVKIANSELALRADMGGKVVVRTQARRKILTIPETALVKTERSHYVYRIDDGKARKTAVELGVPYNGMPTVTKGLSEGDTIVSSAEEDLRDGALVEIEATKSALQ